MSLEEKIASSDAQVPQTEAVQSTPGFFRRFSGYIKKGLSRSVMEPMLIATYARMKSEELNPEPGSEMEKPGFLEDLIKDTFQWTITPMIIVTGLIHPVFRQVFFASNIGSLGFEVSRAAYFGYKKIQEFVNKRYSTPAPQEPSCEIDNHPLVTAIKNKLKNVKQYSRKAARAVALHAATFALASSLAVSHLIVSKMTEKWNGYDPSLNNTNALECVLEHKGHKHRWVILEEAHIYNIHSCLYVKSLVEQEKISLLLSEGVEEKNAKGEKREMTWQDYVLGMVIVPAMAGAGMYYPEVATIAESKKIPIKYLEKIDPATGSRKGLTTRTQLVLQSMVGIGALHAPVMYFGGIPLRYLKFDRNVPNPISWTDDGLLKDRNKYMVEDAMSEFERQPNERPLVRIGGAHSPGVQEEFSKYGKFTVKPLIVNVKY